MIHNAHERDFSNCPMHCDLPSGFQVKIHGGPTGSAAVLLSLVVQYWTSRGWAIADVNYGEGDFDTRMVVVCVRDVVLRVWLMCGGQQILQ